MSTDPRPAGWSEARLADLIPPDGLFTDGDWVESKDQDPNGSIRLLQLADIGDGAFLDRSNRFINEDKFVKLKCTELCAGDVLVARMPDPLGRACLMPALPYRSITVVDVAALRLGAGSVSASWLVHAINSPQVRARINALSSGTTRKRISRGNLANITIPVPPLAEQERIADKLGVVLARVDTCRERLDRVKAIVARVRQSTLVSVILGPREDGVAHPQVAFGTLINSIRGGTTAVPQDEETGYPILRSSSVRQGSIDFSDVRYLTSEQSSDEKNFIRPGDVLFTRLNGSVEYVGNCAVVASVPKNRYQYPDRLYCAGLKDTIIPKYCMYVFALPEIRKEIERRAKSSAGHKRISIQDIREMEIPLPPVAEQLRMVERIERIFAKFQRLEETIDEVAVVAERLTPSLLSKAFRGELVPQDPSDEPAAEMLKRLTMQRADGGKVGKGPRAKRVAPISLSDEEEPTTVG